jgi:DNA-binding MurR/RpiR family transcriptional regulator
MKIKEGLHPAEKEFYGRIANKYPKLSPKKKRVADFILQDYKKLSLMTAKEVALQCQVSEPTIIRFAVNIGFLGYLELVRHVKNIIQMNMSSVDRMINAAGHTNERSTLQKYCDNAFANYKSLLASVSPEELQATAQSIYNARKVYVVGYRASAVPAIYFGYLLKKIHKNVTIDTSFSWEICDSIAQNPEDSVIFAISLRRYSRKVIEFLEYARTYKIKIVGFTDNFLSPLIGVSDQYTVVDMTGVSFVDPLAHVITYLGALIHEIAYSDAENVIKSLKRFEENVNLQREFILNDSPPSGLMPKSNNKKNGR